MNIGSAEAHPDYLEKDIVGRSQCGRRLFHDLDLSYPGQHHGFHEISLPSASYGVSQNIMAVAFKPEPRRGKKKEREAEAPCGDCT
jgi:hypothetical protein